MGWSYYYTSKTDGIPVARRHGGAEFSDRSFSGQIQGEISRGTEVIGRFERRVNGKIM